MKTSYKVPLCLLLLLLLLALSACTPSIPSDLTAPPSESIPEKTEFTSNSLDGIGTICGIREYRDGYLVLSHSGLYTVDQNFENRERLGSPYNDPFDKCEEGTFLQRLTATPNYEERMLGNLSINGEHIFFCTSVGNLFFIDGKETKLSDCGLPLRFRDNTDTFWAIPVAYHDTFYAYYTIGNTIYVIHDGQYVEIGEDYDGKQYFRLYRRDDKLYLLGCEPFPNHENVYRMELHEDLTLGDSVRITDEEVYKPNKPAWGSYSYSLEKTAIESEPDEYGFTETLGYTYTFSRTDGEKVETLECEGLDELLSDSENFFWFAKEDKQFIIITQKEKRVTISTLDFTIRQAE